MSEEQSKINLPTELINEKTFYTLGGASAGVLLICWVINYVAIDVSWLNFKVYRLIGLVLSEAFAILIMLKKKENKSMKWLFAILNGFLIFVNASGLNVMTSSYIFNPKDTSKTGAKTYFHFQKFHSDYAKEVGIFPLPRMINWWPDEKLIEQNEELNKKNETLFETNQKLQTIVDAGAGNGEVKQKLVKEADSLTNLINALRIQLERKQSQIDEYVNNANAQGNNLKQQLSDCIKNRNSASDSLKACLAQYKQLGNSFESCTKENQSLKKQLADCKNQIVSLNQTVNSLNEKIKSLGAKTNTITLIEHIKQACNSKPIKHPQGYVKTPDDRLKEQDFWKTFCARFNTFKTNVE